jgi:hypothetical protein
MTRLAGSKSGNECGFFMRVPVSILIVDDGHYDWGVCWFSSVISGEFRGSAQKEIMSPF